MQKLSIHLVLVLKTSHWYRFHPFYLSISPVLWHKCQRVSKASCTSARHAGSFDCLMASLILITMDNGRGHCAWWQSCTVPNQTHRGNNKKGKMYAIKQIKICAEYRDMLPRPPLDLSGTPGLRPGSMSRYSAQILICIRNRDKFECRSVDLNLFLIVLNIFWIAQYGAYWYICMYVLIYRSIDRCCIHRQVYLLIFLSRYHQQRGVRGKRSCQITNIFIIIWCMVASQMSLELPWWPPTEPMFYFININN